MGPQEKKPLWCTESHPGAAAARHRRCPGIGRIPSNAEHVAGPAPAGPWSPRQSRGAAAMLPLPWPSLLQCTQEGQPQHHPSPAPSPGVTLARQACPTAQGTGHPGPPAWPQHNELAVPDPAQAGLEAAAAKEQRGPVWAPGGLGAEQSRAAQCRQPAHPDRCRQPVPEQKPGTGGQDAPHSPTGRAQHPPGPHRQKSSVDPAGHPPQGAQSPPALVLPPP